MSSRDCFHIMSGTCVMQTFCTSCMAVCLTTATARKRQKAPAALKVLLLWPRLLLWERTVRKGRFPQRMQSNHIFLQIRKHKHCGIATSTSIPDPNVYEDA